ncbi:MAG: hypothetical protein R3B13_10925 [Polyangiaceae bacterium]
MDLSSSLRVGLFIALGFGAAFACRAEGSSGGGTGGTAQSNCSALAECCASITDAAVQQQCNDAVTSSQSDPNAEQVCSQALTAFQAGGFCKDIGVGGSGGGTGATGGVGAGGGTGGGGNCVAGPEDTEAACSDNCDNDGNTYTDCDDFSCSKIPKCQKPAENSNPACSDGQDNDGDGKTDCDDFDCKDRIICKGEKNNATCSDGKDNDGDGKTDCADSDCNNEGIVVCKNNAPVSPLPGASEWPALVKTACTNGQDDDGDSKIDCADFGCRDNFEAIDCMDLPPEQDNASCSDGKDNDKDGFTDCEDNRCQGEGIVVCNGNQPASPMPSQSQWGTLSDQKCSNKVNDDAPANTFIDCDDFGCSQNPDVSVCPQENTDALCSDGQDNDNNGKGDCADFSCSRNPYVTVCETGYAKCGNSKDDDGNSFFDCADFSCNPPKATDPRSPACM